MDRVDGKGLREPAATPRFAPLHPVWTPPPRPSHLLYCQMRNNRHCFSKWTFSSSVATSWVSVRSSIRSPVQPRSGSNPPVRLRRSVQPLCSSVQPLSGSRMPFRRLRASLARAALCSPGAAQDRLSARWRIERASAVPCSLRAAPTHPCILVVEHLQHRQPQLGGNGPNRIV